MPGKYVKFKNLGIKKIQGISKQNLIKLTHGNIDKLNKKYNETEKLKKNGFKYQIKEYFVITIQAEVSCGFYESFCHNIGEKGIPCMAQRYYENTSWRLSLFII